MTATASNMPAGQRPAAFLGEPQRREKRPSRPQTSSQQQVGGAEDNEKREEGEQGLSPLASRICHIWYWRSRGSFSAAVQSRASRAEACRLLLLEQKRPHCMRPEATPSTKRVITSY
jgi:hypothetical protein